MEPAPPHHHHHHRRTTTAKLVGKSAGHFLAAPLLFLLLALLPFSFRHTLHSGSLFLSSYLHRRDPSLPSLLARLSLPPDPHLPTPRRRRPPGPAAPGPFLHLTRVGTLHHDDLLSDDDAAADTPFSPRHNASFPASFPLPHAAARLRVVARPPGLVFLAADDPPDPASSSDKLRLWGLDLDRRDAAELLFLVSLLSTAYGWVILGFLFTYCFVLGTVFIGVSNSILDRNRTCYSDCVRAGCRLGVRRLMGFVLLRWAVRDAFTQFLGIWFFSHVEDQYTVFKLFLQLKMLPFSASSSSPLIRGSWFNVDMYGFVLVWVIVDTFVALLFSVNCWVTIVDSRRNGVEIVREGCYYISIMFNQAFGVKCLESICCGSLTRWAIARIAGDVFSLYVQSVAEVFFMVVWLVFYFAAKARDAGSGGRSFGRRELEEAIAGPR